MILFTNGVLRKWGIYNQPKNGVVKQKQRFWQHVILSLFFIPCVDDPNTSFGISLW